MPCCNFAITEVTGVFFPSFSSLRYKVNLTSAKKQEKHTEVKISFLLTDFLFASVERCETMRRKTFCKSSFSFSVNFILVFFNTFEICIASISDH